ncbi:hypothetical protein BDV96DRAFT_644886 [Lophiotrema nucula]|uniref:Uncharacterized protein n=1 Tax=Lophiotrema nucula TaxID=690887 RepID=A0A6A5ZDE5_9PLEO|nr:hypothetical protein BDV96DRAFT_644886 [Lophiotrema nucula]
MDAYQTLGHYRLPGIDVQSRHPNVYWLDFSQCIFNAYFLALLDDQSRIVLGRLGITQRPTAESFSDFLFEPSKLSNGIYDLIASMYLTQPPCKTIGLYCYENNYGQSRLLKPIHNDNGIRVGEIVHALRIHSFTLRILWLEEARRLKEQFATSHWRDNIWHLLGRPKFYIMLDNSSIGNILMDDYGHGHITRTWYLSADESRIKRQMDWMPENLLLPEGYQFSDSFSGDEHYSRERDFIHG